MLRAWILDLFKKDDGPAVEPQITGKPWTHPELLTWAEEVGELGELSANRLWALYCEGAYFHDRPTMTKHRFFRGLPAAGIRKHRLGTGSRPWVYRVKPQKRAALKLVA